jgi:hypothetical protein
MNVGRLALAAVVAFVVDMAYGFIVYGNLLASQFARVPDVFRGPSETAYVPYLALGILIAMFPAVYIYAKGYEGRSGVDEGLRFGAVIGTFVVGNSVVVNYAVLNVGRRLTLSMAVAALVEWLIIGVVIGLVYKPAAVPSRRSVAV